MNDDEATISRLRFYLFLLGQTCAVACFIWQMKIDIDYLKRDLGISQKHQASVVEELKSLRDSQIKLEERTKERRP